MTKASYYNPEDVKKHFKRPSKKIGQTKLSKRITPGTVLILLTGRFKGRRVVFLKQLTSGLLLVTGPYKVNGVPLKRVNQAYVIPTSTKVELGSAAAAAAKIDDAFFAKLNQKKAKAAESQFFTKPTEISEADKKKIVEKKQNQVKFDAPLIEAVKKTAYLKDFLASRFTMRKTMRFHDLKF